MGSGRNRARRQYECPQRDLSLLFSANGCDDLDRRHFRVRRLPGTSARRSPVRRFRHYERTELQLCSGRQDFRRDHDLQSFRFGGKIQSFRPSARLLRFCPLAENDRNIRLRRPPGADHSTAAHGSRNTAWLPESDRQCPRFRRTDHGTRVSFRQNPRRHGTDLGAVPIGKRKSVAGLYGANP